MSTDFQCTDSADGLVLAGVLDRDAVPVMLKALARKRPAAGARLVLDLSGIVDMDSAAVAGLVTAWRHAQASGAEVTVHAPSPVAQRALQMFRVPDEIIPPPKPPGLFEGVGGQVIEGLRAGRDFLRLTVDGSLAVLAALWGWRRTRWAHLVEQCIYIGSQALPIVGLVSLLVGLTLAFQSAYQLQQFGAAIYVADLIGVSVVREMGPLITAILVAGRSGSSIAAEIGTMQVSEEIDALKVMGLDPLRFLAVPRLLAIVLMVPLLTALADLLGILGGFVVGIFYLDIAWSAFATQLLKALNAFDLMSGLFKAAAFAYGIGLIGLHFGFSVRGGAGEVGRTTTASVVASLFYIILADSVFSVLFYVIL